MIFFNIANASFNPSGIVEFISENKNIPNAIFCFQETHDEAISVARKILSRYKSFSASKSLDSESKFGNSVFYPSELKLLKSRIGLINSKRIGLCLALKFKAKNKEFSILNFHGIAYPGSKLDNKDRLLQSQKLLALTKNFGQNTILGGDFNLLPKTESIRIIERKYINPIKKYNIKSTRNENSWKRYPNSKQYFADYVFVSKGIKVKAFEVPYTEISDHLPMILEFGI